MQVTTVKLSSKGQVVIPKNIRDSFHWHVGEELSLLATEHGVILQTKPRIDKKQNVTLLRGMLQHRGKVLSTEVLSQPVEYDNDRI